MPHCPFSSGSIMIERMPNSRMRCMASETLVSEETLFSGDMMPAAVEGWRPESFIAAMGSLMRLASRVSRSSLRVSRRSCS